MNYIFLRHAQPDYDKDGRLTEAGINQAKHAGNTLKALYPNINHMVSSKAPRSMHTSEIINEILAQNFDIGEIGISEEMAPRETDFRAPELAASDPNMASMRECYQEALRVLEDLKQREFDGDVIITTHSMRMRMMLWAIQNEKEPTTEEFIEFTRQNENKQHDPMQKEVRQDGTVKSRGYCKMFTVDLNAPTSEREVKYPYQELIKKLGVEKRN